MSVWRNAELQDLAGLHEKAVHHFARVDVPQDDGEVERAGDEHARVVALVLRGCTLPWHCDASVTSYLFFLLI